MSYSEYLARLDAGRLITRRHLDDLLQSGGYYYMGGYSRSPAEPAAVLVGAGLLVATPYSQPGLPREVAVLLRSR